MAKHNCIYAIRISDEKKRALLEKAKLIGYKASEIFREYVDYIIRLSDEDAITLMTLLIKDNKKAREEMKEEDLAISLSSK